MAKEGRPDPDRTRKISPLFAELFLADEPDDEPRGGRRARQQKKIVRRRVVRDV